MYSSSRSLRILSTVLSLVTAACTRTEVTDPLPQLVLSPDRLQDSALAGSSLPRVMTIHVTNTGAGALDWVAAIKHASPWAAIAADKGTAGRDSVLIWADPLGLAAGDYEDTVVVEARTGTASIEVPLDFRILALPVAPGPAVRLHFLQPPTNTTAGPIGPVVVAALDSLDNTATSFTGVVNVSIISDTGGPPFGAAATSAVAGVAAFSSLGIPAVGCYRLIASATGLRPDTSASFGTAVDACWDHLVFTVQPGNATVGAPITPAVTVCVFDDFGNIDTRFTGVVTMTIGANPGSGTLSGTVSVPAVSGCATFANLSIDQPGSGYTLIASSQALTAGSALFNVSP